MAALPEESRRRSARACLPVSLCARASLPRCGRAPVLKIKGYGILRVAPIRNTSNSPVSACCACPCENDTGGMATLMPTMCKPEKDPRSSWHSGHAPDRRFVAKWKADAAEQLVSDGKDRQGQIESTFAHLRLFYPYARHVRSRHEWQKNVRLASRRITKTDWQ